MSDVLKVADRGVRARERARPGSPAADHQIGDDHGKRVSQTLRRARLVAMRTLTPTVIPQNDLSLPAASQSEHLDKPETSRYGLELVIPMLIRRLETR
jgi:hypothetical protein